MILPPLGRALPGPLKAAAVLVLALPVVSLVAADALPLGADWLVVAARELVAGGVLAGVLAVPWAVLVGVGRMVAALGATAEPATDAEGPFARIALGVGGTTLLALGAHRGVVHAVAASQGAFPPGGAAAPWSTEVALGTALRSLTLGTAAVVELSAAAVVASLAAAVALALGTRVDPATQPLGQSLRAVLVLTVFGLSLDRIAAGAARVAAGIMTP